MVRYAYYYYYGTVLVLRMLNEFSVRTDGGINTFDREHAIAGM